MRRCITLALIVMLAASCAPKPPDASLAPGSRLRHFLFEQILKIKFGAHGVRADYAVETRIAYSEARRFEGDRSPSVILAREKSTAATSASGIVAQDSGRDGGLTSQSPPRFAVIGAPLAISLDADSRVTAARPPDAVLGRMSRIVGDAQARSVLEEVLASYLKPFLGYHYALIEGSIKKDDGRPAAAYALDSRRFLALDPRADWPMRVRKIEGAKKSFLAEFDPGKSKPAGRIGLAGLFVGLPLEGESEATLTALRATFDQTLGRIREASFLFSVGPCRLKSADVAFDIAGIETEIRIREIADIDEPF